MTTRRTLPHAALLTAFVVALAAAAAASCVPGEFAFGNSASGKSTSPTQTSAGAVAEAAGPLLDALQPGRAVLVDGSSLVKGLPGFGRNAMPALRGEYAYLPTGQKPEDSRLRVSVWFTREPLVYPDEWKTPAEGLKACTTLPAGISLLAALELDEDTTLWALGGTGSTLFVGVPGTLADPCRFAGIFSERFLFFQRYAERPEDTSFPAILDIGR